MAKIHHDIDVKIHHKTYAIVSPLDIRETASDGVQTLCAAWVGIRRLEDAEGECSSTTVEESLNVSYAK
jgi:hypothetical protein